MSWKNTAGRWGPVSQLLHWAAVLLIAVIAVFGLYMVDLPNNPQKIRLYGLHKSLGLTLLVLVALRLAWRGYAGAPDTLPATPRWRARVATLTHAAMYALMLALPLSGWVFNSAAGFPLQWFGLVNLPHIVARDTELRVLAKFLHANGFWMLLALVIAHAGAAFYHHMFQHDTTLTRMLPRRRARGIETPENRHVA